MSAIPLKIFVHGLIALVPTTPGHLTALLVDGRMPMTEQCPMEHHPQLSFFVSESADCITVPGCTLSESQCTCKHTTVGAKDLDPLVGKQIFIEVHPDPTFSTDKLASTPPPPPLPVSKDAAGSFSYVANFAQTPFNKTLNPIYLAANPSPAARTYLVARMDVPYGKDMLSGKDNVTACALATREDGGLAYVHSMSFRKLHTQSDAADPGYALAQKVIAVIDVPDAPPVNRS